MAYVFLWTFYQLKESGNILFRVPSRGYNRLYEDARTVYSVSLTDDESDEMYNQLDRLNRAMCKLVYASTQGKNY